MSAPALPRACLLVLGVLLAARLETLPGISPLALTAAAAFAALCWRVPRWRMLGWALLGSVLLCSDASTVLDDRLDPRLAGNDIETDIRIVEFPRSAGVVRLLVEPLDAPALPRRIRLSWYDAEEEPALGDCWRMTVRLQRPRGFANPGRFDYEQWLLRERVGASGYVRKAERLFDCPNPGALSTLRGQLLARLQSSLPADDRSAVLVAITLGARQWLDEQLWQVFMRTGTGHLMAISGMHIALAAAAVFGMIRLLLGITAIVADHRRPATWVSLVFAAGYALVSGFGIPSRRAMLMLLIAACVMLLGRRTSSWQVFAVTLVLVTASTPLDTLSAGFLLSFSAVGLLIHQGSMLRQPAGDHAGRLSHPLSAASALMVLQLTLLFGLLPLTAGLFGRVSLVAPVANMIVLPVFGFLVLPAALAGTALANGLGDILLLVAWHAVGWVLKILRWFSALPLADLQLAGLGYFGLLAAAVASLATVLPPGWPLRNIRWLALALLLARPPERPPEGCIDIDVLDVGQGLAVVLRSASFTLVYDAGPAFRSGGDTGRLVLAPFLAYLGVDRVDMLVLSHDDLDHTGGLRSLALMPKVETVLRGEPSRRGDGAATGILCRSGQLWFRDAIRFTVLGPAAGSNPTGNAASCVLEVSVGGESFLLTGDIEAAGERALLRNDLLTAVDLLLVPHHGSKTSSHRAFVERTSPQLVVASAGHGNRWGMPVAEVVLRWQDAGAEFLSTAASGAIGARLCGDQGLTLRYQQRRDGKRLWHDP